MPLAEVTQRLDLVEQQYVGVRAVPLNRILGTLDRTRDFDRRFRPGRTDKVERLNALRRAFPNNDFPPIAQRPE